MRKLGKFIRLVQNEYIKILKKVSTWIMLILILVVCVGYFGVSKIAEYQVKNNRYEMSEQDWKEQLNSNLTYAKETKYEGWEADVAEYQFCLDHEIFQYDWRRTAVTAVFHEVQDAAVAESLKTAIINEDWKAYFQYMLDAAPEGTEEDGWLYQYCIDHNLKPDREDATYRLAAQLSTAKAELASMEQQKENGVSVDANKYQKLKDNVQLYTYRLDHSITFDVSENTGWFNSGTLNFWTVFSDSYRVLTFVGILMIMVCGAIVSSEFSQGTIKFLLINPAKRWKILAAKYVTAITFGYCMLLLTYLLSGLGSMLLFGTDNLGAQYFYVSSGAVKSMPGFVYILRNYMLSSVNILVMSSLAFAISSLVRNTALSVGIGMGAMLGGSLIVTILSAFRLDWARFLIFSNTDLIAISQGNSAFMGQTVGFALCVLGVHLFIFLLTAWDGFVRREV